jgi:hypothetical protein
LPFIVLVGYTEETLLENGGGKGIGESDNTTTPFVELGKDLISRRPT